MTLARDRWIWLALALGAALRVHRLEGDLPYVFHYDEPTLVDNAVWMWQHGTLDPHFFNYPTGLIYLLAALYGIVLGAGMVLGRFGSWSEAIGWLSSGTYERPPHGGVLFLYPTMGVPLLYLIARGVSTIAGIATIWLAARVAAHVAAQIAENSGLGAHPDGEVSRGGSHFSAAVFARAVAFLVAVSPLAVEHSHLATTDMTGTAIATAALLLAVRPGMSRLRDWFWAGACTGLAAGVKYNLGLVGTVLALRAVLEWRRGQRTAISGLALAAAAAGIAFLATSPYVLLDSARFRQDLGYEFARVRSVTEAFEGAEAVEVSSAQKLWDFVRAYLGAAGFLVALVGAVVAARSRSIASRGVVLWVAIATLPMLGWRSFYPRYLLGPWPALLILVALGADFLSSTLLARMRALAARPRARVTAFVVLLALLMTPGVIRTARLETRRARPDPRIEMTRWVEANVPEVDWLVAERAGPFPAFDRVATEKVDFLGTSTPEAYLARGIRYLASSGRIERVEGHAAFASVVENQERIARESDILWKDGKYVVYYLKGGPSWDLEVRSMLAARDTSAARERLERAVSSEVASYAAWLRLGDLAFAQEDRGVAERAFQQVLLLAGEDEAALVEAHLALADLAMQTSRWEKAADHLSRAESIRPEDAVLHHNWAILYLYLGRDAFRSGDAAATREAWLRASASADAVGRLEPADKLARSIREQVERMKSRWGITE